MWLNVKWYDSSDVLIAENGAYGPLGNVVQDLAGNPHDVKSIIDPQSTKVYEAKPAMTREWANQLLTLGYPTDLPLQWDRMTNTVSRTLGDLAAEPAGSMYFTFHFVLNNAVYSDNRIPPYGFDYDAADIRNALPVPDTQYGNPGSGGTYNYWDEVPFPIPAGADHAEISLFYQSTSWEYVQFLWKQNDTLDPFLGAEGINLLDAWLNTAMCQPFEMATTSVAGIVAPPGAPGEAATAAPLMLEKNSGNIDFSWGGSSPDCDVSGYALYAGDIHSLSTGYTYQGALTCVEPGFSYTIAENDPQVSFSSAVYFVIVSGNDVAEGSYGRDSLAVERPQASGICHTAQDLDPCS